MLPGGHLWWVLTVSARWVKPTLHCVGGPRGSAEGCASGLPGRNPESSACGLARILELATPQHHLSRFSTILVPYLPTTGPVPPRALVPGRPKGLSPSCALHSVTHSAAGGPTDWLVRPLPLPPMLCVFPLHATLKPLTLECPFPRALTYYYLTYHGFYSLFILFLYFPTKIS